MEDHYATLRVRPSASQQEIERAYRRLARELHPDTNPDPQATERFKKITVAYETLRDPERRRGRSRVVGGGADRAPALTGADLLWRPG